MSTEETSRYEELAKAQYADFYHSVARPSKLGGSTLTDISHNYPSSSSSRYPMNKAAESSSQPPFDNVTMAYNPQEGPSNDRFIAEPSINATLSIPEDEYLAYFNSSQVIHDLSMSAVEQGRQSFEAVFKHVVDGHISANIQPEFSPFDEPLPFSFDDAFFEGQPSEASSGTQEQQKYSSETKERSTSPSSGFVSGSERSISPNSNDGNDEYRLAGKLIPENHHFKDDEDDSQEKFQRRRGRQSKDNDLVRKYNLPASAEELAAMSHKALQRLLKDPTLSEPQRSLIKKIRRRGRNKEAARKCRERRVTKPESPQRFVIYPPGRHD